MSNQIGYASKYTGELDKMIVQASKTGFLTDNVFKAKFVGSRTVLIPELNMDGLGNYNRAYNDGNGGYSKGDTNLTYKSYELEHERSKQLFLDAQDADESGVPDLVGKMVGEFTRTKVIPEMDAHNISAMFGVASDANHVTDFVEADAVAQLLAAINNAEAAMGYDGSTSLVAMVDPVLYNILQTSTELQRHIVISDFKQGEINVKVKNLNGCAIIPVEAARMKSNYTFNDNGFAPDGNAKDVRAIVLPKDSASFIKKVDKVNVIHPDKVEDYDAYKINFRTYYDLIVKESRKGTIFAIATA